MKAPPSRSRCPTLRSTRWWRARPTTGSTRSAPIRRSPRAAAGRGVRRVLERRLADLDVPWTVRLVEIVDGPDAVVRDRTPPDFGDRFGPVTTGRFRHDLWLTADELVGMVTTRSPYLVGTPEQQRLLIAQVHELLTANPALVGRFAMPHVTRVHRAVRV